MYFLFTVILESHWEYFGTSKYIVFYPGRFIKYQQKYVKLIQLFKRAQRKKTQNERNT